MELSKLSGMSQELDDKIDALMDIQWFDPDPRWNDAVPVMQIVIWGLPLLATAVAAGWRGVRGLPVRRTVLPTAGVLLFFFILFQSFARKRAAGNNPWGEGATTLEWTLSSPPPFHQFNELPRIK